MAVFSVYNNNASFADGFFPVGVEVTQTPNGDTGKDYMFTVGDETRIIRVFWDSATLNIYAIGLYLADDDPQSGDELPLGEIEDISTPLTVDQFEDAWLSPEASSSAVFALIMNGNDTLNGSGLEDTFVPGLGNDTVFGGGDSGVNDYDYVNYSADNRQHGITVDLDNGDAADDQGKVTSRGGTPETDILHSINSVYATKHDDLLIGDNHDNEFYAGFGNDTIHGGDGPVDNFDVLSYRPDGRTQGITVTFTAQGSGTVTSNEQGSETDQFTGIEAVYGTAGNDRFTGAAGSQRFRGFAGNDTFDGGAGDDEVDYRSDTAEVPNKVGITVDLSSADENGVITVTGVNGDTDTLISIERIRGTRNNDNLRGTDAANRLRGDSGNDVLSGLGSNDRLEGGAGNDIMDGGSGNDTMLGDAGNDHLYGGLGFDTLDGSAGNDVLIGGIGDELDEDYFVGSLGNDSIFGGEQNEADNPDTNWNDINYNVDGIAGITVTFNENASQYGSGTVVKRDGNGQVIGTDSFFSIHAVRGTNGADTFTGGGSTPQRFVGYGGDDVFDGTKGVNEIDYRAEARAIDRQTGMMIDLGTGLQAEVTDATGEGTDTLISIERVRGTEYDDAISGNNLNNRLRGDAGNDRLIGRDGDDRLEGGFGFDTLDGGAGNDILVGGIGNATDEDYFLGSKGSDAIYGGDVGQDDDGLQDWNDIDYRGSGVSGIKVTFADDPPRYGSGTVEKLDGTGTDTFYNIHAVRGTGGADEFIGGENPDPRIAQRFIGYAGADIFDGTKGTNEVDYRAEARAVNRQTGMTIDLGPGLVATVTDATGHQDTLKSIERVRGTEHADTISGNGLNNRLRGDAGNDTLMGRTGNDRIEGGLGDDTVVYSGNRSDYRVNIDSSGVLVIADQRASGDGVDTVIDSEFFNFGGTTLNLAQVINYGSGIDLSNGMVAENSKTGAQVGALSVANPDATSNYTKYVLLNDAGGRFQLGADGKSIEVKNGLLLDFEAARIHTIKVQAIDEFLQKSLTFDLTVVLKDVTNENAVGSTASDTISGGASTDTLSGGAGNDSLNGGGGSDKVDGGVGNDRIIGGSGKDTLSGGAGKDVFAFANKDTGTSKGTADYITDFSGKGGDKIDLKAIDADTKKKGDQAFTFIGKNDFTKAGQVRYEKAGKDTYVYLNTDSDKTAEGVIKLKGAMDLQKGWFVL